MTDELLMRAQISEREREIARNLTVRAARAANRPAAQTPTHGAVRAPASLRLLRLLSELYGPSNSPDQDPELFSRLAWTGTDDA